MTTYTPVTRLNLYGLNADYDTPQYAAIRNACISGDKLSVQSIFQSAYSAGLDLHQREPQAQKHLQKCLFESFINKNFDIARYLIREAGVEMKSIDRQLAYHASNNLMPVEAFEFLIHEGWDINSPIYEYRTGLSYVLRALPLTKWFLEHGADPNLGPDTCRQRMRNASMVSKSGFVLGLAACTDPFTAVALIDLLILYGAKLEDSIPLHHAAGCQPYQNRHEPVASTTTASSQAQGGCEVESTFTLSSRIPVLQHLLDLGYDINASDRKLWGPRSFGPPLHWAIYGMSLENTQFLLGKGADPWALNPIGFNALEAAKRQNEICNPSGKEILAQKFPTALTVYKPLGGTANSSTESLEKVEVEGAEVVNEPLQESELEKLIRGFM